MNTSGQREQRGGSMNRGGGVGGPGRGRSGGVMGQSRGGEGGRGGMSGGRGGFMNRRQQGLLNPKQPFLFGRAAFSHHFVPFKLKMQILNSWQPLVSCFLSLILLCSGFFLIVDWTFSRNVHTSHGCYHSFNPSVAQYFLSLFMKRSEYVQLRLQRVTERLSLRVFQNWKERIKKKPILKTKKLKKQVIFSEFMGKIIWWS